MFSCSCGQNIIVSMDKSLHFINTFNFNTDLLKEKFDSSSPLRGIPCFRWFTTSDLVKQPVAQAHCNWLIAVAVFMIFLWGNDRETIFMNTHIPVMQSIGCRSQRTCQRFVQLVLTASRQMNCISSNFLLNAAMFCIKFAIVIPKRNLAQLFCCRFQFLINHRNLLWIWLQVLW